MRFLDQSMVMMALHQALETQRDQQAKRDGEHMYEKIARRMDGVFRRVDFRDCAPCEPMWAGTLI